MQIYYVAECLGGDFDNIPISMFGQPALFTEREAADKFCAFANGSGRVHEVREWECRAAGREEAVAPVAWLVESGAYRQPFLDQATANAQVFELRKGGYEVSITPLGNPYTRPTAPAGNTCWCLTCDPVTVRMALCPDCGNKRCPKANDHRNTCTGSNEPGQKGSAYENCTAPAGNGGEVDWSVIEPVLICIDDLSEFLSEAPSTKLGAGTYAEAALDIRAAANLIRTLAKKPD